MNNAYKYYTLSIVLYLSSQLPSHQQMMNPFVLHDYIIVFEGWGSKLAIPLSIPSTPSFHFPQVSAFEKTFPKLQHLHHICNLLSGLCQIFLVVRSQFYISIPLFFFSLSARHHVQPIRVTETILWVTKVVLRVKKTIPLPTSDVGSVEKRGRLHR